MASRVTLLGGEAEAGEQVGWLRWFNGGAAVWGMTIARSRGALGVPQR